MPPPWAVDKAVLDHRGLRVHAHDFVRLWLIAGDGMQASWISSWISCVPEALSSISTTFAAKAWHCSRTAL
jgi:hypothetical protein